MAYNTWGVVGHTGKFSTSDETAYPPLLAYHIAFQLAMELVKRGWTPPISEFSAPENVSYQYLRAVVGVQPKASKIAPLVAEFSHVVAIQVPLDNPPPVQPGEKLTSMWRGVPSKSCLLKRPPLRLNGGKNAEAEVDIGTSSGKSKTLCFGVYRSGTEFVKAAVDAGHPIGREATLPPALRKAVTYCSSKTMHEVAVDRHSTLSYWLGMAKELSNKEKLFHEQLPERLQSILMPKKLLLWREMLEFYGYPDLAVFDEVTSGTDLVGAVPTIPYFDPTFKPAKMTVKELGDSALSIRKSLLSSIRSSGDDEIDLEVYNKTMDELQCGWLEGPLDVAQLAPHAIINRRFGIKQTSGETVKVRLIDDFSASGVNSTVHGELPKTPHPRCGWGSLHGVASPWVYRPAGWENG